MKFREALRSAVSAARANFLPGMLLQCLMVIFFSAYVAHEGTRAFLAEVATFKQETGYLFAFVSYVFASALLPEVLRVAFFQGGRVGRGNVWSFLTAAPLWGTMGIVVDAFYRMQAVWFGAEADVWTVVFKVLVDQFLYSPFFATPVIVAYFYARDRGFRRAAWERIFSRRFVFEHVFPTQVAGWLVWIPGVFLIYAMPSLLQIPVAVLIQTFWILIFTTLGERLRRREVSGK